MRFRFCFFNYDNWFIICLIGRIFFLLFMILCSLFDLGILFVKFLVVVLFVEVLRKIDLLWYWVFRFVCLMLNIDWMKWVFLEFGIGYSRDEWRFWEVFFGLIFLLLNEDWYFWGILYWLVGYKVCIGFCFLKCGEVVLYKLFILFVNDYWLGL